MAWMNKSCSRSSREHVMYLGMENAQHRMVGHLPRRIKISEPESNLEVHPRSKVCESHDITQILNYIISYVYRHMDYGILETTYHFSEPRFPKENVHEFDPFVQST